MANEYDKYKDTQYFPPGWTDEKEKAYQERVNKRNRKEKDSTDNKMVADSGMDEREYRNRQFGSKIKNSVIGIGRKLRENAPAFKRGVDSLITGAISTKANTDNKKNGLKHTVHQRQNVNRFNPFESTGGNRNSSFNPFLPTNTNSDRRSGGPFDGGDYDFINKDSTAGQHKEPHKHASKKHDKKSDRRDIHIHIHK